MKFSEETDKIIPALFEFRSKAETPKKNKFNPHFKNKYSDLQSVIDAVLPAMLNAELFYQQETVQNEKGETGVYTSIFHKSGQFVEFNPVFIPGKSSNAQSEGSAISYGRRYSLSMAAGVASDEDDDAEGTMPEKQQQQSQHKQYQQQKQPVKQPQKQTQPPKQQSKPAQPQKTTNEPATKTETTTTQQNQPQQSQASGIQRKRFFAIAGKKQISEKQQKAIIYFYTGKDSRAAVTEIEYQQINEVLEKASADDINSTVVAAVQKKQGGAA
jgi:hypothetical protein